MHHQLYTEIRGHRGRFQGAGTDDSPLGHVSLKISLKAWVPSPWSPGSNLRSCPGLAADQAV